jgi:hypothetical protein
MDAICKFFLKDANKPTLETLSYALRHPETWPEGFIWNYQQCDHCAMGLARALWNSIPAAKVETGTSIMARTFALPYEKADCIFMARGRGNNWAPSKTVVEGYFWNRKYRYVVDYDRVTPEMVADQIDKYIAEQK